LVYAQTIKKILQSVSMNMNAKNLKSSGNTTWLQKISAAIWGHCNKLTEYIFHWKFSPWGCDAMSWESGFWNAKSATFFQKPSTTQPMTQCQIPDTLNPQQYCYEMLNFHIHLPLPLSSAPIINYLQPCMVTINTDEPRVIMQILARSWHYTTYKTLNKTHHICANTAWGTPDLRKTSLISRPDTKPSLSTSVWWNRISYLVLSSAVTIHGATGREGIAGCK